MGEVPLMPEQVAREYLEMLRRHKFEVDTLLASGRWEAVMPPAGCQLVLDADFVVTGSVIYTPCGGDLFNAHIVVEKFRHHYALCHDGSWVNLQRAYTARPSSGCRTGSISRGEDLPF